MIPDTLAKDIAESIPKLLDMARTLTWNKISDNCKFILTEIQSSEENLHKQKQLLKSENDRKMPLPLQDIIPTLEDLYDILYDINLHVYRATKDETVIDIRYFTKSSLTPEHRNNVADNPPMLHCKVPVPPWLPDTSRKFDINWQHNQWLIKWKMYWAKRKFR